MFSLLINERIVRHFQRHTKVDVKYVNGNKLHTIRIKDVPLSWQKFKMGFGEHKGRTLLDLAKSNYHIIKFLSRQNPESGSKEWAEAVQACRECVNSINL